MKKKPTKYTLLKMVQKSNFLPKNQQLISRPITEDNTIYKNNLEVIENYFNKPIKEKEKPSSQRGSLVRNKISQIRLQNNQEKEQISSYVQKIKRLRFQQSFEDIDVSFSQSDEYGVNSDQKQPVDEKFIQQNDIQNYKKTNQEGISQDIEIYKENQTIYDKIQIIQDHNLQPIYTYESQHQQNISQKQEIKGNIIKWKMGDLIGSGGFGQVFSAMDCSTGQIFAVKKIDLNSKQMNDTQSDIENELKILQKMRHKHIIGYLGHEKIDDSLYIYLEYMSVGNISSIIQKYGSLEETTIKIYARQIIKGLIYLHNNQVIHKDLKGANILVDSDGTVHHFVTKKVKLSDFGCSKLIEKTLSSVNDQFKQQMIQGSIPWMAPEVIKQSNYCKKADIWSLGCTFLEMATGKMPWHDFEFDNPIAAIMKIGLGQDLPNIPDTFSDQFKQFLNLCLNRDVSKRATAEELLKHPFLQ